MSTFRNSISEQGQINYKRGSLNSQVPSITLTHASNPNLIREESLSEMQDYHAGSRKSRVQISDNRSRDTTGWCLDRLIS